VTVPSGPPLDPRRAADFTAELVERARAWIGDWGLSDASSDFGLAFLKVAARFSGEVAQRLDRVGEKMSLGFLDWLAMRGKAAHPARMPVSFKLADSAKDPVLAVAPVQLQAGANGTSVIFETETDVRLVPGRLNALVAVDPDKDAFYLPPPGLTSLDPLDPLPTQWQLKSFAPQSATTLQLDPPLGIVPDMVIEVQGDQYRVTAQSGGLATINPGVSPAAGLTQGAVATKVTAFRPFDAGGNAQQHALYIGDDELLNLEAAASIKIVGVQGLPATIRWEYWGKVDGADAIDWQPLTPAAKQPADGLLLTKPKGAIEQRSIAPEPAPKSRWIRGVLPPPAPSAVGPLGELALTINPDANLSVCGGSTGADSPSATAEGFANSTALDFNSVFYPLGREPHQFDTFSIGCTEAFSKGSADVAMCFELSDLTSASFSQVRSGVFANRVLASVATDRALHLLAIDGTTGALTKFPNRDALQPPSPADAGASAGGIPVPLDAAPPWKLPIWANGADFWVATYAGAAIWVWHENGADPARSGWVSYGALPVTAAGNVVVQGLAYVVGPVAGAATLFALYSGQLFAHDAANPGAPWNKIDTGAITLSAIVSVVDTDQTLAQSATTGLVGVATDNLLYYQNRMAGWTALSPNATQVTANIRPAALANNRNLFAVAVTTAAPPSLVAIQAPPGGPPNVEISLQLSAGVSVKGSSLDAIADGARVIMLASLDDGADSHLAMWAPFEPPLSNTLFEAPVPPGMGPLAGAPTALDKFVVVPGGHGTALVATWNIAQLLALQGQVGAGIVVPTSVAPFAPNDIAVVDDGSPQPRFLAIANFGATFAMNTFYPLALPPAGQPMFGIGSGGLPLLVFRASGNALNGTQLAPGTTSDQLTLAPGDHSLVDGSLLLVGTTGTPGLYRINLDTAQDPWVATLTPAPPAVAAATAARYWHPEPTGGRVAPTLSLDAANRNWDAALLDHATLHFGPAPFSPSTQTGKAVIVEPGGHPILTALDSPWTAAPPSQAATFNVALDAAVGAWTPQMGDNSANPQLAWEYWNGSSWWKLDITLDETLNLKTTGLVRFTVPTDLARTEVFGRNNYWIRARLIGGDYGREQVSVITKDIGGGQTQQTIQRSSDGIRPPAVIALRVRYKRAAAAPQYVVAQDSGSLRDQSDANRTGASVEAFVPLATLISRLTYGPSGAASLDSATCIPDCQCDGSPSTSPAPAASASPPASSGASGPAGAPPTGRAIFLGLDAKLVGAPINIFLLVDQERPFDGFAPLAVDALIGDRFAPLVVRDTTRALGESGLMSLSFSVQPEPRELFGQSLTWLRLRPSRQDPNTQWAPAIGGAYLNAVWTTAAETMTREPVGSSDGRPNLTLQLARPPVLDNTLELRVRESLDGEERSKLVVRDPTSVLSAVRDLPGDWVLWRQVVDPADYGATDRVYALDEVLGQIAFGDGLHGMVPPIGQDNVVAFGYRRTEPAPDGSDTVPANAVPARAVLSLVTPIEGAEAAYSADHAAGGAPAESGDRVLRFSTASLRHRGRALTAQDFEDLALASSVDIAQARCFVGTGGIRIVVVMRGAEPRPTAATRRELHRALVAAAPVAVAKAGALTVAAPRIRYLRVDLTLEVPSLDDAGVIADAVKSALAQIFDPATGGSGNGWQLGAGPTEDDIALALINVPKLQSIQSLAFYETAADGSDALWGRTVRPDDMVMLAPDPVRIVFAPLEAVA
jgi:hypothetical protein